MGKKGEEGGKRMGSFKGVRDKIGKLGVRSRREGKKKKEQGRN